MTHTKIGNISQITMTSGLPDSWKDPISPERFVGKHEGKLGRSVDISQFGVNIVVLEPGSISSLRHWHEAEDEFVYVLSGELTLVDNDGEHTLRNGSYAGFRAGSPNGHHLVNNSSESASFLAIGTRQPGVDVCHYPDHDIGPIKR
jgi:uncharacterized cupin superfamily protein